MKAVFSQILAVLILVQSSMAFAQQTDVPSVVQRTKLERLQELVDQAVILDGQAAILEETAESIKLHLPLMDAQYSAIMKNKVLKEEFQRAVKSVVGLSDGYHYSNMAYYSRQELLKTIQEEKIRLMGESAGLKSAYLTGLVAIGETQRVKDIIEQTKAELLSNQIHKKLKAGARVVGNITTWTAILVAFGILFVDGSGEAFVATMVVFLGSWALTAWGEHNQHGMLKKVHELKTKYSKLAEIFLTEDSQVEENMFQMYEIMAP